MTRIIFYTDLGKTKPEPGIFGSSIRYTTLIWEDVLPASLLVAAINLGTYRFPLVTPSGPVVAAQYGEVVLITRPDPDRFMVKLTPREIQVLTMLAEGCSLQQIALQLGVKPRTITIYLTHLKVCFNAATREQVVARAVALGLFKPSLPKAG